LKISRVTLSSYVRKGLIKVTLLSNGFYDYHNDSVYSFIGKNKRMNVIYGRVSTYKQKTDLYNRIDKLKNYCADNYIHIDKIFQDISSGIELDRPEFSKLMQLVFDNEIDTIYITYRDRLTRLSYITLKSIFYKFGTKIVVINKRENETNYDELFDEISSLMYYFSTKKYSNRRSVDVWTCGII